MNTLPKSERLCGKTTISALMTKGRWGHTSDLKYCWLSAGDTGEPDVPGRIMVSVPKRLFKRAVKRNLLKRRLREAYRTNKSLVAGPGLSIMFLYNTKEVMSSEAVASQVIEILTSIADERKQHHS